jgi:5-methyltetrahydrofolate--homocysteine methyltransferase
VHTAVKIHPNYRRGQTVYVTDASRAVGVVSQLMSKQLRGAYVGEVREEYARIAAAHARGEENKRRLSLKDARRNALKLDWANYQPPQPSFLGTRVFADYPVAELIDHIDWSPFFSTWELTGKFPAILDGDVLHTLRQQLARREGRANVALADFIAPQDSGVQDYIGAFVVTAGIGEDVIADRFKHANDDYSSIMVKALADRLAEAFAERMHQRVRKEFWGYAADETLSSRELIEEKYRGIRPAPGYPAQPDHTEKGTLFSLIDGERIGVKLTESYAMWPGASVSGLYFSHPEAHYFGVGKIERDQVEDYARRKGWSLAEAERWLAPVLNYDPLAMAREAAE